MLKLCYIAIGGATGAVARWAISGWVARVSGGAFPWGTVTVNLAGSFLLGLLACVFYHTPALPAARAGLMIGLLGAFTTFSTFSVDTLRMLEQGQARSAVLYSLGSVVAGLLLAWAGVGLGRVLAAR